MEVPHANRHPEQYEWVNVKTGETRPATEAVPLGEEWRLRKRSRFV